MKGPCRMLICCLRFAQVLGPGDSVLVLPDAGQVRVGAGLHAEGGHLRTTRAGVLRRTKAGKLWVQGRQKRCGRNLTRGLPQVVAPTYTSVPASLTSTEI